MITSNKRWLNGDLRDTNFLLGKADLSNSFSFKSGNTGNGTVNTLNAIFRAPTELWTLVCTDDSTSGSEKFSVQGAVSGSQAEATVGNIYDNGIVTFKIVEGSTNFAKNDTIYIAIKRDITENTLKFVPTVCQIEVTGDSTICDITTLGTIATKFLPIDNIVLVSSDFSNGGKIVSTTEVETNNIKAHFNNVDTTIQSTVYVYVN